MEFYVGRTLPDKACLTERVPDSRPLMGVAIDMMDIIQYNSRQVCVY